MVKKSGLGKGLSALIPVTKDKEEYSGSYQEIPVVAIEPNPEQPRHHFNSEQLEQLSQSIKQNGVIQPIIVTRNGSRFTVIAGERRWRATQMAGYEKIPAVVRNIEKGQMLTLALLENIQRQELNPIEEALAYQKLLETHAFTHETLATNLGKNRVTISNTIRLLKLPASIQDMIQDGDLSFGHARCLITLKEEATMERLARSAVEQQWPVRELERRVKQLKEAGPKPARKTKTVQIKSQEKNLTQHFDTKVSISGDGKSGKIVISYASEKQYKSLLEKLIKTMEN